MAVLRTTCSIPALTNLPEDTVVNTFHFMSTPISAEPAPGDLDAIEDKVIAFYDAIDVYYPASTVAASGWVLETYDLGDPEPRVPLRTTTFSPAGPLGTGDSLPSEVALCLSYHGAALSGASQARRRGRIYIGPVVESQNTVVSLRARPGAMVGDLASQGTILAGPFAGEAGTSWQWAVFSPTNLAASGELAASVTPIVAGWVDNAWDTQRRRGKAPTARTTWTA